MPYRNTRPEIRTVLGVALRRARWARGMTQMQLEQHSGPDQTTISRLERGRDIGVRLSTFLILLDGLGTVGIALHLRGLADDLVVELAEANQPNPNPPSCRGDRIGRPDLAADRGPMLPTRIRNRRSTSGELTTSGQADDERKG